MNLPTNTTLVSRSALGLLVLFAASSALRADVFVDIADVKGEASDERHKNWVTCDSVAFGVARAVAVTGANTGLRSSAQFSEITLNRLLDVSSCDLFFYAAAGGDVGDVVIEFTRPGREPVVYLRIELSKVIVTGYWVVASDETLTEKVTLSYSAITMTYTVPGDGKSPSFESTRSWNVENNAE